jgi:hypothetical protein
MRKLRENIVRDKIEYPSPPASTTPTSPPLPEALALKRYKEAISPADLKSLYCMAKPI